MRHELSFGSFDTLACSIFELIRNVGVSHMIANTKPDVADVLSAISNIRNASLISMILNFGIRDSSI